MKPLLMGFSSGSSLHPCLRDDKKGVRGASPHTDPQMDRLNVPQIKFVCPTNNPRRLVFISLTNSSQPGLYCHGDVPLWLFGHTCKKHFTYFPMVGSWAEQYTLSTSTSQCAHVQYSHCRMCSVKWDPIYNQPDLQSLSIWWVGNKTLKATFLQVRTLNELKHVMLKPFKCLIQN